MNDRPSAGGLRPADPHPRLRQAALAAVTTGVVLLAAAAFLLSYAGIHHIAQAAGVPPTLARLYPLIFDAMLVVAASAALALRGAGWLTRCYVWLSLLLLLAAVAAGDAVHATGTALPRRPSAAIVAVIPWVLVLLAFGLLLAMLRQVRRARAAAAAAGTAVPSSGAVTVVAPASGPDGSQPARTGIDSLLDPRPVSAAPRLDDRLAAPTLPSAAIAGTGPAASQVTGSTPPDATRQEGAGQGVTHSAASPGANGEADGGHGQYEPAAGLATEGEDEDSWAFEDLDADDEPELDHEQGPDGAQAGEQEAAYGADEHGADEHGADEHGADEHGADEGNADGDNADEQEPASGQALPLSAPPPAQFDRLRSTPTPPQD